MATHRTAPLSGSRQPLIALFTGLVSLVTNPAAAQDSSAARAPARSEDVRLSYGSPAAVGMSPTLLDAAAGLYRDAVRRGQVTGAVVLVARNGTVVLHESIGSRNVNQNLPVEKNTMFRMASNTKPVTATAIAILVDRGKVAFSDNVRIHIPSFDNYRSGFIQVRHLLSHTSGLGVGGLFVDPLPPNSTLRAEVDRIGAVGASELPGLASFSYNNAGYNTLGALVEVASGKLLGDFFRDELYRPLGMVDSYNLETAEALEGKLGRVSAVYRRNVSGEWSAAAPGSGYTVPWKPGDLPLTPFVRASGGMISTAWDYAVFLQMYLNGGVYGGVRILKPETVKVVTSRHAAGAYGQHYGYGWFVNDQGIYSHGGGDGTFGWVDPDRGIIGVILTNTTGPDGLALEVAFSELVKRALVEE